MMSVYGARTKKDLRGFVGRDAGRVFLETSLFGPEYRGDGTYPVVGPSPTVRKWYAQVTVRDGRITKVC